MSLSHSDLVRVENKVLSQISQSERYAFFHIEWKNGSVNHFETVLNLVLDSEIKTISDISLDHIAKTVLKCFRAGINEIAWLNARYHSLGVEPMSFKMEKAYFAWVTKSILGGATF